MVGFRDDMVQWVAKVADRIQQLPGESAKLLVEDVRVPVQHGGNMPVRTGNLRNSAEVSFTGIPLADLEIPDGKFLPDPTQKINSHLARAKPGALISIGFRAIYGPWIEPKYAFVRLAAQKWRILVDEAVKNIKARTR